MAVLIIFPVILQTDINVIMLSIGGQGDHSTLVRAEPDTQGTLIVSPQASKTVK